MLIVVTYVKPGDSHERIYVCEALGFDEEALICRRGDEGHRIVAAAITGIVSVITGETMSLFELATLLTKVDEVLPVRDQ